MRSKIARKIAILGIVCLFTGALLLSSVTPALAWGTVTKHAYHFWAHNNTGIPVNDAMVWGTTVLPPPPHAPWLQAAWNSGGLFPVTTGVWGMWRWVKFGPTPGVILQPSSRVWFNVDFREVNWRPLHVTAAWFRWTRNNIPVGPWVWLGWRVGSPVALYNPEERPDGTMNTENLVVTNLQFAHSPERFPNDRTTLENPEVLNLNWTPARDKEGNTLPRIVVPPSTMTTDSFFDVFFDVEIIPLELTGGSSVLARGNVEVMTDGNGTTEEIPFVVQFIAEESSPAGLQALEQDLVNDAIESGLMDSHVAIPLPGEPVTLPDGTTQVGCDGTGCHPDSPPWDWKECNTCHGPAVGIDLDPNLDTNATGSHQSVSITQEMKVDVHHTIKLVKIEGNGIYFGSLNPLTRRVGTDVFWILVSSNDEYQKSISWTDFKGYDPDNYASYADAEAVGKTYTISNTRLKVKVTKAGNVIDPFTNGGTTPVYDATPSQFERVDLNLGINWNDHAGSYTGTITIQAFQV